MLALAFSSCDQNSLNVPHKLESQTELITAENTDKAINECDQLVSLYIAELKRIENQEGSLDSGITENKEIITIDKLNQKLEEKISKLENSSFAFTEEQIEKFKIMQERYYFHAMISPSSED